MWNLTKRLGILMIIALWQPIQFLIFARRVLFKNDQRMFDIALYYDLLANVSVNGSKGESISSRTGRGYLANAHWARVLLPFIDSIFGAGHCVKEAQDYLKTINKTE